MIDCHAMAIPEDPTSSTRRQSWSVRLSPAHINVVERGCIIAHGGVASWFVERAFLDYAAKQGALNTKRRKPPLVIGETPDQTLANIIVVQDTLAARLERTASRASSVLYAREETVAWLSQYLLTGAASHFQIVLPATPPLSGVAMPLNLKLLPIHLALLQELAGDGTKADVIGHALDSAGENLGIVPQTTPGTPRDDVDARGLPRVMVRYPHPELMQATKVIEDSLLGLLVAYDHLAPVDQTPAWRTSSARLMGAMNRIRLRLLYAREHG
jgi:hypothetical protein